MDSNDQIDWEGRPPLDVIRRALDLSDGRMMISSNFRPTAAVLLHMAVQVQPDIPVIWVDHGYNTAATYRSVEATVDKLGLNLKCFVPLRTRAHRDALYGGIPDLNDSTAHAKFTEEVKLEPFRRAMAEIQPRVWLTALRRDQSAHREGLEVVSETGNGVLKVCPLLRWTEGDMLRYIREHDLPSEANYYDPTKVLDKRECGLHLDYANL